MNIDLHFPLTGRTLPLHHTPLIHAALCAQIPALHGDTVTWALHRVRGTPTESQLLLQNDSRLSLRMRHEDLPLALPLAGRRLRIGPDQVQVGAPSIAALAGAPRLTAWMVTIKGYEDGRSFLERAVLGLEELGVQGRIELGRRRVLRIHGKQVVGWAVALSHLSAEHSMILLQQGLGGRRRLGCGVFVASEAPLTPDLHVEP